MADLSDDVIKSLVEAASGIDIVPELLVRVPEAVEYVNAWRKTLINNGSLREESPTNEFLGVLTVAATWIANGSIAARVRAEALREVAQGIAPNHTRPSNWIVVGARMTDDVLDAVRMVENALAAAVRAEAVADAAKLLSEKFLAERDRDPAEFVLILARRRNPDYDAGYRMAMEDAARYARSAPKLVAAGSVPVATPPAEPAAEQLLRDIFMDPGPVATPTEPDAYDPQRLAVLCAEAMHEPAPPVPAVQPDGWGEGTEAADHPVNCECPLCVIDRLRDSNDSLREQLRRAADEIDRLRAEQPEE